MNDNAMTEFFTQMDRVTRLLQERGDQLESRITSQYALAAQEQASAEAQVQELGTIINGIELLQPLLEDESINDILINGPGKVFVERAGKLEVTDIQFENDSEVLAIAQRIVEDLGRKFDSRRPLADTRLANGSRVNIIAPPLSVDGTTISIRKFSRKEITLDRMVETENLSTNLAEFFESLRALPV